MQKGKRTKKKGRNVREKWVSGYVGGSEDGAKGFAIANSDFTSRWLVGGDEKKKKKKEKNVCAEIFSHRPRRLSQVINKSSRSQKYTFATVTRT